jgi:foldase protein PrsA
VSKPVRVLLACGAALLLALEISSCGGGSNEVIARVGNNGIGSSAFEHWMSIGVGADPARSDETLIGEPPGAGTASQRTMGFLIASARTLGEAAERGITFTSAEAAATLEFVHDEQTYGTATLPRDAELKALLAHKHETPADQLWIVKVHMLAAKLEAQLLSEAERRISRSQIAAYYAANRPRFAVPELRDVVVIETFAKAKAEEAKREIDAGESLLKVMKRRDDEPNVGGFKPGMSRGSLPHEYEQNYFRARAHVLVGPLKAEIYYLFEVTDIMAPREKTLPEVQAAIRQELIAGPEHHLFTDALQGLRQSWKARTHCSASHMLQQLCGGRLA